MFDELYDVFNPAAPTQWKRTKIHMILIYIKWIFFVAGLFWVIVGWLIVLGVIH